MKSRNTRISEVKGMNVKRATLVLAALVAVSFLSAAPSDKKADPRIEAVLKRLDIKYTVNSSGNVVVTYSTENDRSQAVYIMSATDKYNGVEIREIWSIAGSFDAPPSNDILVDIMTESGKNKIGCWALENTSDGKYLLFYTIKFPAEVSDEAYQMMLEFASSITDQREQALFNSDEN
jgi:hypothetical protein